MSRKSSLKKEQKLARNSLEIRRPNFNSSPAEEDPRSRERRANHKPNYSAAYTMNNSRVVTDGELSAGVTAQLKNCVREMQLKRPNDVKLFAKRQTGSLYTGFGPVEGKQRPTNLNRSGERRRSAYEEVLEGDRIKRFHTEKVSLNPSEKNIIKKRRLSFGKDLNTEIGRSSELKKTIQVDERKKPARSIDKQQGEQLYNHAVDLLSQNKVKQAIRDFEMLIEDNSTHKSGSYLWLAICYKKLGKLEQSLEILNRALIEFPKHYEALVYRAKLLTKTKRYDRAKRDAMAAIALEPDKPLAYMAKADCLRASGDYRQAEKTYEQAIRCEKTDPSMLYLKKIQMEVEQLQYDAAWTDIEQLLKLQPYNSEALAFKGIIQKQKRLLVEAALTFEQSLKHNNSRKGVSRALYELVKLKMEHRDYYEAYYALSRSNHLDVDASLLENFRLFNEAAILLMKRKFEQAITVFNQLQTHEASLDDFLRPLYHQFKGYGYFCLGKHKEAIIEYNCLDSQTKDNISIFNQHLCEGIVEAQRRRYEQGISFFRKAKDVFPNKVQPYIYTAVTYVREANDMIRGHSHTPQAQQKRQTAVFRAMDEMNSGNLINDANSNLLYHRAILCYYFRDFKRGLEDINRCIQKAEDNIPKYFFLRGLGYACSRDPGKAISEFSICVSLDHRFALAYVHRAKCLFLMGQTDNAFKDLHSYMQLQSKDMSIHKWIGDLLYQSKSYTDALKTYIEIEDAHESQEIVIMRVRCRVRIGLLEEARADLNWLAKANKRFTVSNRIDLSALSLLGSLINREPMGKLSTHVKRLNDALSEEVKGEVFRVIDCMTLIGVAAGYMGKYSDSISSFMLVRQLFQTNAKRNRCDVKSEVSEEYLNLSLTKINYNIFLMKICDRPSEVVDFVRLQLLPSMPNSDKEKLQPLLDAYLANESKHFQMVWNGDDELTNKMRWLDLPLGTVMLKTKLQFGCYHQICNDLYPYRQATGMIELLTVKLSIMQPTYVEDKPEAPWIRRNNYGVVFTEDLLKNESIKLETTEPDKEESQHRAFESFRSGPEDHRDDLRNFRERIRLDDEVQQKLMRMLQKTPEQK